MSGRIFPRTNGTNNGGAAKKAEEIFDATTLPIWDLGPAKRFGANEKKAENFGKIIKECFEFLGEERFAYCVGNSSYERVSQITNFEHLVNLVNTLLCERKAKEQEK